MPERGGRQHRRLPPPEPGLKANLCGGPDQANRQVLATFSSIRFPGLALLIASITPLAKKVVPVVLAYVISSVVFVAIYSAVASRRKRPAVRSASMVPTPRRA